MPCRCKERHGPGCGPEFIARAHTRVPVFRRVLMGLLHHVQDRHEWKGGKCKFHPLRVGSCGKCEDPNDKV